MPRTMQYSTAMTADSVGVKIPLRMPPITITIISRDGTARRIVVTARPKGTRSRPAATGWRRV